MPRYKCKVDVVYSFDFEVVSENKETLEDWLSSAKVYDTETAHCETIEIDSITELPEIAALFTYPELPENASDRMKEAYKVMVEEIQLAAGQPIINDSLNQETKEKIRKQSDTAKITKEQYDEILLNYEHYKQGMLLGVNSSQKLTEHLNKLLGLNKSRSVYSKIWCGGINRESLPKGE